MVSKTNLNLGLRYEYQKLRRSGQPGLPGD
jgi:hypothetical protein